MQLNNLNQLALFIIVVVPLVVGAVTSVLFFLSFVRFFSWMKEIKQKPKSSTLGDEDSRVIENLYLRIVDMFEKGTPYLNPNLSINDVASELYTNKTYVSKALAVHAGMNFCQFVNSYRIRYAVAHFKQDPTQRVVEMAQSCGFRTVSSFTVSFRMIMNSSPGEWCNAYRVSTKK